MRLTSVPSREMKRVSDLAPSWVRTKTAVRRMVRLMQGRATSHRHRLFFQAGQREGCSGRHLSLLHRLSSPGVLGGGGSARDTAVLRLLVAKVFLPNLEVAEGRLREVAEDRHTALLYCSSVLLPETLVHLMRVRGRSRREAEELLLEVVVEEQERRALEQEIRMATKRGEQELEQKVDEWVDHSELSDAYSDHSVRGSVLFGKMQQNYAPSLVI